ncbi:MAG: NAD(P)-dependent oxidoreductase [Candidatus Lokiarchaeia archaeon]
MKLTIFGATGGTGKQLIEQALEAGNHVVAYARNPSKLNTQHEHLTIVQGELTEQATIERAVSGADAVISVLGPRGDSKGKPITQGTQNILAAMKKHGVRRLIISSTPSASDPNDSPDFKFKFLVNLIKLLRRAAYEEIISVAEAVRMSDLDWTIVRVSMLNNKPRSGKVRVGYLGKGDVGLRISRADLAEFMLKQVKDTRYLRQAPVISN